MSILRDLGILGCLAALSPMISLKSAAFPREGEVEIRLLARVSRVHHADSETGDLSSSSIEGIQGAVARSDGFVQAARSVLALP
jgi:hypothetical protein